MTKWINAIGKATAISLLLAAIIYLATTSNVHHLYWHGILARQLDNNFIAEIYLTPKFMTSAVSLHLPDGSVLQSDQLTKESLERLPRSFARLEEYGKDLTFVSVRYDQGLLNFHLQGGVLSGIHISADRVPKSGASVPALVRSDGTNLLLPVKEEELTALLGPPACVDTYRDMFGLGESGQPTKCLKQLNELK
jgi:hypothetical protein